jgi:uncharacterized RDD family membrane protein YckC
MPAHKGTRLANFIIDLICIYILYFFLYYLFLFVYNIFCEGYLYVPDIFFYLTVVLYYFFFEYFFKQTPGKFITKTEVVSNDHLKSPVSKILLRSIVRLLPWNYMSFLFGYTGLHDLISRSNVYYKKSK